MYLHHVGVSAGPEVYNKMREFYLATLGPVGYKIFKEKEGIFCGLQAPMGAPDFWLHARDDAAGDKKSGRTHVAFGASSEKQVDEWYRNAVNAGGTPNGPPGERRNYVEGYYAAYVIDPMGNNVEVVYFNPLWIQALKASPYIITGLLGATVGYAAHALLGN
ncbi:hypothetical protein GQ53DRAFT_714196 [Thozetella sp. PMI_491]|nr:hypothetical protein GQ53DRAFT_714196 [Thozetella sp. PMI_491]